MPKKPANKTSTTMRRSSKRKTSRVTVVTSKTHETQLRRALSRRRARTTKTELIDHAVPSAYLFQGVISTYTHAHKPAVERGVHDLSPFVLSLKPHVPSPQEVLEAPSRPSLGVNLLENHRVAQGIAATAPDLSSDLVLTPREIEAQLAQDVLAHHGWGPMSLPLNARLEIPPLDRITHTRPHHEALRYDVSAAERFTSDAFIPHTMPEDIFSYFDFPDEEFEEEADVVTLEELDEPDVQDTTPAKPQWVLGVGWQRAIASFVGLSFLFVLPLHAMNVVQDLRETKSAIERSGEEAVSLLSAGAQAALAHDVAGADAEFRAASDRFSRTKNAIADLGVGTNVLLSVLPVTQDSYRSGQALVEAGRALSVAASRITAGYTAMENELSPTPISRLNLLEAYLTSTVPHLETAQESLAQVTLDSVPESHRDTLTTLTQTLPAIIDTIHEFKTFYGLAKQLLGGDGTKRYLIVFQNNTEIRPTGGFIGSFAEIKVHDGVIEHLNVPGGGAYDLQGTLRNNLIPPQPLQLLSARWEFQDGNWFPDFPTSARQLMQFYRDAGGPSVDGVLAVNATFVADLIGLLGPIEMEDYGRTINAENFIFEAQKAVELEYDKQENTPKAFIGDLAPLLVERAVEKTSDDFLAVVDSLNAGLSQKDLQLYLADETLQRQVLEQGWGGEVKWTDADYLMVVDTNLGGGKTDGVIEQKVDLQVDIADDGTITNTLTISRTHYGIQGLLFTGVNNVDFLRVYVPKGSTLIEASGFSIPDQSLFDIPDEDWLIDDDLAYALLSQQIDPVNGTVVTEEHGKAVFGNWVQTKPGTTSTVIFRYTLPFTLGSLDENRGLIASLKSLIGIPQTQEYRLTIQKQSGIIDRTTTVRVNLPDTVNPLWSSHDLADTRISNDTDTLFAILLESL